MQAKQFYSRIIENYKDTELALLLQKDARCGFYDLCQRFLDIALNAGIIHNEDGSLSGYFYDEDILVAKETTIEFITNNNLKDIDGFFEILNHEYSFAIAADEKRRKSKYVENPHSKRIDVMFGMNYDLTRISKNVYDAIVSDIKTALSGG